MSTINPIGKTEKKLQRKRVPEVVIIQTNVFLVSKTHTRKSTLTLMTPPGCYSGAHVLDVSRSVIPSKTPWCESKKWYDSTCCRFPLEAYQYDLFQMQISLLIIAVRFLGEEFKEKATLRSDLKSMVDLTEGGQWTPEEWPLLESSMGLAGVELDGKRKSLALQILAWVGPTWFWQPLPLLCWLRYLLILVQNPQVP